jgi:hypothetical protein
MTDKPNPENDQRGAFRVSLGPEQGVTAHLILARKRYRLRIQDVSAEGMFVELESNPERPFKLDTMVDIELAVRREKFVLFGVIRSQRAGGYGVHFPERDPAGRFNPLGRLAKLVLQAQRTSLVRERREREPWH